MTEAPLFDWTAPKPETAFSGVTYDAAQDHARLTGLLLRVYSLMLDGEWRTLGQIAHATAGSEASVSARLRDLRKAKYGSRNIARKRLEGGLWAYRLEAAE